MISTGAVGRYPPAKVTVSAPTPIEDEIHRYLSLEPRQLPSRWLYDSLGSSLFEAICLLPWYRIARAELRLLSAHGSDIGRRAAPTHVVELGCGNGEKLVTLVQGFERPVLDVHLIDVSARALARSRQALDKLAGVRTSCRQATYEAGLVELPARAGGDRRLVTFLGSNIGNFDPPGAAALLHLIRSAFIAGDWLLLGADLVKPERDLLRAYDDPLGVTAAFNKNLLLRLNTELAADFDLDGFAHRAVWNGPASRVEMHLVSRRRQHVHIPLAALRFVLEPDEMIWTESAYKYRPAVIRSLVEAAGFGWRAQWIDGDALFMLALFEAV